MIRKMYAGIKEENSIYLNILCIIIFHIEYFSIIIKISIFRTSIIKNVSLTGCCSCL